jgi:hypothetical protein
MPAERWIRIEFPYEIKNIFREAFPAAKYDGHRRYWLVSAAESVRLQQWVEVVERSGVLAAIATYQSAAMSADEIAATRQMLDELRAKLADGATERERDKKYQSRLARMRAELAVLRAELAAARVE